MLSQIGKVVFVFKEQVMKSGLKVEFDLCLILVCMVCWDVQNFDLFIVDMEEVMGDQWGDLGFFDVLIFFDQVEV